MDYKKILLTGSAAFLTLVGLLYAKNVLIEDKSTISKEQILKIITKVRKQSYGLYRQITPMIHQMNMQYQGKLGPEQMKMYIESEESGINFKVKIEEITEKVCQEAGTNIAIFEKSLKQLEHDKDVSKKLLKNQAQYRSALAGKLIESVVEGLDISVARIITIQNRITKTKYLIQVEALKKMVGKTEQQLMDPALMRGLNSPQVEQQKILIEEGFGETDEPASLVYAASVRKHITNPQFKIEFAQVEFKYKKLFEKYIPVIQRDPQALHNLEQEIVFLA